MSNRVTDTMAAAELVNFTVPVSVVFITKGQDWRTRQKIDYEASKGLMKEDFLGLKDWAEQVRTYSQSNPIYLMSPYGVISPLIGRNRNVLMQLALNPQLGWVGRFLMQVYGFEKIFTAAPDILNNSGNLSKRLGL